MTRPYHRPHLHDPDGFYAAFVAAHQGLSDRRASCSTPGWS